MFFSKKPAILYLQKDGCIFYTQNHSDGVLFKFPEGSYKNNELVHEDKISDELGTFIAERLINPSSFILILSAEVFSQKVIDDGSLEEQQKDVTAFIKKLDISEEKIVKETFELDNKKYVLVANKKSFTPLLEMLRRMEWKALSIISVSLFRDISDSKIKKDGLNQKELQEIYANIKLIKTANIMGENTVITEDSYRNSLPINKIAALGGLVLLVGGLGFFVYSKGLPQLPSLSFKNPLAMAPTPTPSPQPTPTPTSVPTESDKTKLSVDIQNGTGTPGQAAKVKSHISKLGYTDIKTENGSSEDNKKTQLTFSSKVSQEYKNEITKDLEKIFTSVNSTNATGSAQYDIVILTGEEVK